MSEENRIITAQNTGNPVLDSFVNFTAGFEDKRNEEIMVFIHDILLKLAAKEPGGLRHIPGTESSGGQPQE